MPLSPLQTHHAALAGSGSTCMALSHGFGCDHKIWQSVTPGLVSRCRTLVFDHAGCGASLAAWDPVRHESLHGYADDLLSILDAANLDTVLGVGHSVGGIITMLAALAQPQRFSQLILLAPSPCFLNDPPDYLGGFEESDVNELLSMMEASHFGWAQFLAPLAMGQTNPIALTREFEQSLRSLEPRVARHFASLAFRVDVRHLLPRLTMPVMIVQCARDSLAPASVGRWMNQQIPGSRLIELDVAGHCPHVSHPSLVTDLLARLVDA